MIRCRMSWIATSEPLDFEIENAIILYQNFGYANKGFYVSLIIICFKLRPIKYMTFYTTVYSLEDVKNHLSVLCFITL